jgi:hypothetical protein
MLAIRLMLVFAFLAVCSAVAAGAFGNAHLESSLTDFLGQVDAVGDAAGARGNQFAELAGRMTRTDDGSPPSLVLLATRAPEPVYSADRVEAISTQGNLTALSVISATRAARSWNEWRSLLLAMGFLVPMVAVIAGLAAAGWKSRSAAQVATALGFAGLVLVWIAFAFHLPASVLIDDFCLTVVPYDAELRRSGAGNGTVPIYHHRNISSSGSTGADSSSGSGGGSGSSSGGGSESSGGGSESSGSSGGSESGGGGDESDVVVLETLDILLSRDSSGESAGGESSGGGSGSAGNESSSAGDESVDDESVVDAREETSRGASKSSSSGSGSSRSSSTFSSSSASYSTSSSSSSSASYSTSSSSSSSASYSTSSSSSSSASYSTSSSSSSSASYSTSSSSSSSSSPSSSSSSTHSRSSAPVLATTTDAPLPLVLPDPEERPVFETPYEPVAIFLRCPPTELYRPAFVVTVRQLIASIRALNVALVDGKIQGVALQEDLVLGSGTNVATEAALERDLAAAQQSMSGRPDVIKSAGPLLSPVRDALEAVRLLDALASCAPVAALYDSMANGVCGDMSSAIDGVVVSQAVIGTALVISVVCAVLGSTRFGVGTGSSFGHRSEDVLVVGHSSW